MPETSYVYAIGYDTGPQKVGFSRHPPTRAFTLRKAGAPPLKVHSAVAVSAEDVRGVEGLAHWILRDRALGEELFDVSPEIASETVFAAAERYAAGERVPEAPPAYPAKLSVAMTDSLALRLDDWRVAQPKVVSKSEAARQILEWALNQLNPPAA